MGKLAAAAAFGYAVLSVGGNVLTQALLSSQPKNDREQLQVIDADPEAYVVGAAVQGLALLLMAGVLYYVFKVVRYRRPELPSYGLPLALLGSALLAVSGVFLTLDLIDTAAEFLASGERTESRAEDLQREISPVTVGVGAGGAFALALSLVLICMGAMRSGVLSRFMGVIGIIVGSLYVLGALLQVGQGFVQLFWVMALGFLFLNRWPGGRGPAWETGEPIPWPSAAERRAESAGGEEGGAEAIDPPDAPEPEREVVPPVPHPVSNKRKRKRRR